MSTSTINDGPTTNREATALSPSKLAILIPYALFLWCIAWSMIHFRGPHGIFQGSIGIAIYVVTIPITVLLNRFHLKLTGLPKAQIVNCVAITLAAATTIDGICLSFFPTVYGNNPDVLREGAAYIIWAGAVACWLAFGTLHSAQKKFTVNAFERTLSRFQPSTANAARHSLLDRGGFAVATITGVLFLIPAAVLADRFGDDLQKFAPALEIRSLIFCCLLALALSVLQIFSHIVVFGGPVIRGNRDDYPVAKGFAGRLPRAHANLLENLLPFAVAVFAATALGISDRWTAAASLLFAFARIIHAGTYVAGVTIIRSAAFYAGLIATVVIFAKAFL